VKAKEKVVYKRFSQRRGVKKINKEPPQRSVLITMEVMCSCKNMVRRMRRRRAMSMTCMEIVFCFLFLLASCLSTCLPMGMWVPTYLIICVGMIDTKAE